MKKEKPLVHFITSNAMVRVVCGKLIVRRYQTRTATEVTCPDCLRIWRGK